MIATGAPPTQPSPRQTAAPSLRATVGLYLLIAVVTLTAATVSYRSAATILKSDRSQELDAAAAFKVDQVVRWRAERLADARTLAADPLLAAELFGPRGQSASTHGGGAEEELREWFEGLRATGDYVAVALTDVTGRVRLHAGVPLEDLDRVRELAARALGSKAPFASDVEDRPSGTFIDFVAPIALTGTLAGAVLIRADPRPYLFRIVGSWHRPSPSAEGLIVQRLGGEAVVVNAPRHGDHPPMTLRMPLAGVETPAVRAAVGRHGTMPGRDYRGVAVLAATAPVPDSPWSIVVKEDLADVLAPLRERGAWTLAAALAILAVAAAASSSWWRVQRDRAERIGLLAEVERSAFARKIERLTRFAHDMVFLADDQQRIVEVNDRAVALLGYSREELLGGMRVRDLREPATIGDYEARVREQVAAGGARFETCYRCKDGTPLPVEVSVHTEEIDGRRYFHGIARDIGDRKRLEAQLVLAARLASVGTLAGGVAHEINNPLAFILSNVEFALALLEKSGGDPELVRALEDTRDGGRRVREIVRGLQAFARRGDFQETLDVREVARAAASMVSNELRHRARLVVEAGEVPPVRASASGLGQAFLNLLANAAQAIPEGHAAENVVRVATSTAADGRAVVEVSDSGVGIPPELLPRIFDPFFTTRPVGAGTGLGLSTCHGIVTAAGGEITVESAVGKGTTFRVLLPPAPPPVEEPSPPKSEPAPPARRLRILVVDDEPLVGTAVARTLSSEHEVVTRTSAEVVLREVLAGARYDLILCDLMMPNMTGMELHARLAATSPDAARRMVFLTGGAFTTAAQEFIERTGIEPLEKPFDPRALRERIARALEEAENLA